MMNNAALVLALDESAPPPSSPSSRHQLPSEPCLLAQFPNMSILERDARELALHAHPTTSSSSSPSSQDSFIEPITPVERPNRARRLSIASIASMRSAFSNLLNPTSPKMTSSPTDVANKQTEPFEVLRAVEQHDITFLMQLRDREFRLLTQNYGNTTPLTHAIRLGHQDVAIVLLGAFSRWINHLEDEDMREPSTTTLLKALRANLKLAIDEGLAQHQSDLISSFMQTLIMSEGDKWVWAQVNTISLALNAGPEGQPVALALSVVRSFATKRLGKANLIASLEDYISNATVDLLMMSAWSIVLTYIEGEQIPSYYFARDLRVYGAFQDRLEKQKDEIKTLTNKRLKQQLRVLSTTVEGRTITFRAKVDLLANQLENTNE